MIAADGAVPAASEGPEVLGDTELQGSVLESLASAVNYNDWLVALAVPYLGDDPVELGSGLGDYAQAWVDGGTAHVTTSEADPVRLAGLRTRFAGDPRFDVTTFDVISPPPGQYSAMAAFNVLEHIPDDVGALRGAATMIRPGGHVIIFVPAFQWAMSRFDREVGHVRRYTRSTLRSAMTQAGLEVVEDRYVNLPGLPAWFLGMRLARMSPGEGPLLTVWDRFVIPLARRVESRVRVPFGQSVFAVGRVGPSVN